MWLFCCFLLVFVFLARGEGTNSTVDYEMYKRTFQYYDKYIYSRYLETEKQTCELSKTVVQNLQKLSSTDVWDPLWMVSDHLLKVKTIAKDGSSEMCVEEISDSWDNFVSQETNILKLRLGLALIEQETQQTFVTEVSNNYTLYMQKLLESIYECREKSSPQLTKCISDARNRRGVQKSSLYSVAVADKVSKKEKFLRPCMTAFQSSVLGHHTDRTEKIFEEIERVQANLYKCSNQTKNLNLAETIATLTLPDPYESSDSIQLAQRLYEHAHNHVWKTLDAFIRLDIKVQLIFANVSRYLESDIWENPRRTVLDYVHTLEKSRIDYPDLEFSKCDIGQDMNITIADGVKEVEICRRTYGEGILQSLAEGEEKFKNITKELSQAGNVAILNCINDPYAFQTNRMEECFMHRFSRFNNMWDKMQSELEDLMTRLNMCLPKKEDAVNPAQLCGDLQYQRMMLRASQLLYDYRKCLFLETGRDYNITLPAAPADPSKPSSVPETESPTTNSSDTDPSVSRAAFFR